MTDFSKLILSMREWNDGAGIDVRGWLGGMGNYELAIAYSALFWPAFVEFEKYVLRAGFSIDSLRGFERQCNGNRRNIESVMNHLHIADIHTSSETITQEQLVYLGRTLKEIYSAKLAWQFPSKQFEVWFDESETKDLTDYQITFMQI